MFWQPLFWGLLIPCLIVLGILYGTTRKVYKLFYILSLFVYVIAVAYIIDVFDLGRNWILALLVFSAVLMILIAAWLSRKGEEKPKKRDKSDAGAAGKRHLWTLLGILVVMLLLIIVSGLDIGVTREVSVAQSLERSQLIVPLSAGEPYPLPPVPVANYSYANAFFLPVVVPDQYFLACWYDTKTATASTEQLQTLVNGQYNEYRVANEPLTEVPPGGDLTLAVTVTGTSYAMLKEAAPAVSAYDRFDAIVLASLRDRSYVDCSNLPAMKDDTSKVSSYSIIPLK